MDSMKTTEGLNLLGEELSQFISRYERMEAEKKDLTEGQKEIMAEANGRGYDVPVLKAIIAKRKKDASDLAEFEAVQEMCESALGM